MNVTSDTLHYSSGILEGTQCAIALGLPVPFVVKTEEVSLLELSAKAERNLDVGLKDSWRNETSHTVTFVWN